MVNEINGSEEGMFCCLLPDLKHFSETVCQCQQENMYLESTNCLTEHMSSYTNTNPPTETLVSDYLHLPPGKALLLATVSVIWLS